MKPEKIEEILAREEIQVASLGKRVLAYIIDGLLFGMVNAGLNWDTITQGAQIKMSTEDILNEISTSMLIMNIAFFVYRWLFVYYFGATIGKMVVKIKVIETELLDNPNIKQAFVRSLLKMLSESFLMYVPFLYILTNPLRLSLHDRIANTVVVELNSYNA